MGTEICAQDFWKTDQNRPCLIYSSKSILWDFMRTKTHAQLSVKIDLVYYRYSMIMDNVSMLHREANELS